MSAIPIETLVDFLFQGVASFYRPSETQLDRRPSLKSLHPVLWRYGDPNLHKPSPFDRVDVRTCAHDAVSGNFATASARAENVTPLISRSVDFATMTTQYSEGTEPRRRMALAVPYDTPMSSANSAREGHPLIISTCDFGSSSVFIMVCRVSIVPAKSIPKGHYMYPERGYFM